MSVAICAHSVLPSLPVDYFFFAPQLLFPYENLIVFNPNSSRLVFSHSVGMILTLVHWSVVTVLFAWAARRVPLRYAIPLAAVTIFGVGFAMQVAFELFGVSVSLDGP